MTAWLPGGPALWADLILVLHAGIVVFVVLGQLAVAIGGPRGWRWVRAPLFRLAHLATIAVVVAQAWLGRLCPLTIWEHELRLAAGQQGLDGSFIQHWVGRLLYFDLPLWVFALIYTAFALWVVYAWWRWPPHWAATSR